MALADFSTGIQGALLQRRLQAMKQAEAEQQAAMEQARFGLDQQRVAQQGEQFDARLGLDQQRLGQDQTQFDARLGLDRDKLGVEQQQWEAEAPHREAQTGYLRGQSQYLEESPLRTEAERQAQEARDKTQHGYRLGEIAASGQEARNTAAIRVGGKQPTQNVQDDYATERRSRTLESVRTIKDKVGNWTAGVGSMLARFPATDARDFAAELDTLKANIAFGELTEMRAASKTGGALGQVSERELALLTSTLGALDPGQSPANLREQLQKIEDSLARWEAMKNGGGETAQTGEAPPAPAGWKYVPKPGGGWTAVEDQ